MKSRQHSQLLLYWWYECEIHNLHSFTFQDINLKVIRNPAVYQWEFVVILIICSSTYCCCSSNSLCSLRFSNVNAHFLRRFAPLGALVCEGRAGFWRAGVRSFEAHDEAVSSLQLCLSLLCFALHRLLIVKLGEAWAESQPTFRQTDCPLWTLWPWTWLPRSLVRVSLSMKQTFWVLVSRHAGC